jgi:hypothetical protein
MNFQDEYYIIVYKEFENHTYIVKDDIIWYRLYN